MSNPDITLGAGDRSPLVTWTILDRAGNPVDLTGATITFSYRLIDGSSAGVTEPGAIVGTPTKGNVSWHPAPGIAAGIYHASWGVLLASADPLTYPSDRWLVMKVLGSP